MPTTSSDPAPALGRSAVRGAASSAISQLARIVLQVGSVIILARLLSPTDYGLVAMVWVVIGIGELFRDFGLSGAAIQARVLTRDQRNNLLWLNATIGMALALVVAAVAPAISRFYDRPELTGIALALAPTFVVSGLMAQYRVDLARGLRFHALALIDLAGAFVALVVGVALAWQGAGYWALVAQQLCSGVLTLALLVIVCRWIPGRPRRHSQTMPLVRFGSRLMTSGMLTYVAQNTDSFVVGHVFGASPLGVYNRSLQTIRTPLRQAQAPFGTVMLPVLARLQDEETRFLEAVRRSQTAMSYTVLGVIAVIVAVTPDFVLLTLGTQWSDAVDVMRFVAIGSAMAAAASPASWIFIARGMGRALVSYGVFTTAVAILCIVAGSRFGVAGVAAGYATAVTLTWPVTLYWVGRVSGLDTRSLQWAALRAVLVTGCAGLVGHGLGRLVDASHPLLALAVTAAGVAATGALAAVAPSVRRDYSSTWDLVRHLRRPAGSSPRVTPGTNPG